MAIILYSAENIGDQVAPSLNAAFVDIFSVSGIRPRVVAPYGGWSSVAIDELYGIKGRSRSSDHYKGRAVDIANYAAIEAVIGRRRLQAILRAHGWLNVQLDGSPFPAEPWHFANQSAHPQTGTGIPGTTDPPASKPRTERQHDMRVLTIGDGEGRFGPKGQRYFALVGPQYWEVTVSQIIANYWAIHFANVAAFGSSYGSDEPYDGGAFECTYAQWEAAKVAAGA